MEYRFRGFDAVGNKGWVYGDLVHNKKITETGLEDRVMVGGYEVVLESVGLWTGLKDKVGCPVYEGDIVKTTIKGDVDVTAYIAWNNEIHSFVFRVQKFGDYCLFGKCEVIDTMYENKELLER